MQNFIRISSLVKILFLEFVGGALLASVVADLYVYFGGFGCAGNKKAIDFSFFIALLIGLVILIWICKRSLQPKIISEEFRPILKLNFSTWSLFTPNPTIKPSSFSFFTNHALYFFVQLITVFFICFFIDSSPFPPSFSGCAFLYSWVFSRAFLIITILFIFIRLGSWFILKRKIKSPKKFEIYKSIIILWCFVLIIPLLYYIFSITDSKKMHQLPIITDENFSDYIKNNSDFSNSFVRLKSKSMLEKPLVCECENPNSTKCVLRYVYTFEQEKTQFVVITSGIDLENKQLLSYKPADDVELVGKIQRLDQIIKNSPTFFSHCFNLIPPSSKEKMYFELGKP